MTINVSIPGPAAAAPSFDLEPEAHIIRSDSEAIVIAKELAA